MKEFASWLVWSILFSQTRPQTVLESEFDENEFKKAVVQAYNSSKLFTENFYELLGLICPESVYCQTNGTFDTDGVNYQRIGETDLNIGTEGFLQDYNHSAITEARTVLRKTAHHLPGCCSICTCTSDCKMRQNCCPSMDDSIAHAADSEMTKHANENCIYANSKYYKMASTQYTFSETIGSSYYMVTGCASMNVSSSIATKCIQPNPEQQNETSPVYSTVENKIYRNKFCARCNDASSVTAILPLITIKQLMSFTETVRLPSSPDSFYKTAIANSRLFNIAYPFPTGSLNINDFECIFYTPTSFESAISICDEIPNLDKTQKYFFKRACSMKQHLYHTDTLLYKNVFCFLCYETHKNYKPACGLVGGSNKNSKDSYSVLLGALPDSSIQPDEIRKTASFCNCTELFDTSKKVCREIFCPLGEMRIACDCVPFITNFTGMRIKLHLEIRPRLPDSVAKKIFGGELQNKVPATITNTARGLVASKFGPLISDAQFLFRPIDSEEISPLKFHYCQTLTFRGESDFKTKLANMFTRLDAGLTKTIAGTLMDISLGQMFDAFNTLEFDTTGGKQILLEPLYPEDYLDTDYGKNILLSQPLKKTIYCKRVKLTDEEVDKLQNATASNGWPQAYLQYVFWQEDGSMCLEDFEAAFMAYKTSGAQSNTYKIIKCDVLVIGACFVWRKVFLY